MRTVRVPRWRAQADIHGLVRSFPSERVRIYRPQRTAVTRYGQTVVGAELVVFDGEALFIPAGGDVKRFGLGQVEEESPRLLVPGWRDIRQGDMVRHQQLLPGGAGLDTPRLFRVRYAPDPWHAWTIVTLEIYQQGT